MGQLFFIFVFPMKNIIYILFVSILFVQCISDSTSTEIEKEEVSESVIKKDSVDVDAMIKRDQERFDSMKNALLESIDESED